MENKLRLKLFKYLTHPFLIGNICQVKNRLFLHSQCLKLQIEGMEGRFGLIAEHQQPWIKLSQLPDNFTANGTCSTGYENCFVADFLADFLVVNLDLCPLQQVFNLYAFYLRKIK